jgi:hypothetical protein
MFANANGWQGPPIKADDEAKTGRLREEDNAEWRAMAPVPFGLLPKTSIAALHCLAGFTTRLRHCELRWATSAEQRVREHSLNRPYPQRMTAIFRCSCFTPYDRVKQSTKYTTATNRYISIRRPSRCAIFDAAPVKSVAEIT